MLKLEVECFWIITGDRDRLYVTFIPKWTNSSGNVLVLVNDQNLKF